MSRYHWLLLDADNTLFDFDGSEAFALNQTMVHFGVAPDSRLRDAYHFINVQYWTAFDNGEISQEDLVNERFSLFVETFGLPGDGKSWNDFYREALANTHLLLPGAERACRRLSDFYTLSLITNGVSYTQRRGGIQAGREECGAVRGRKARVFAPAGVQHPQPGGGPAS